MQRSVTSPQILRHRDSLDQTAGLTIPSVSLLQLRRLQTSLFSLRSEHTRLHVEVWRAEQDLKNGQAELEAVEERKRFAEAGIKR